MHRTIGVSDPTRRLIQYFLKASVSRHRNEDPQTAVFTGWVHCPALVLDNKKAPRKTAGLLILNIMKRNVPSLAGLAATYSSKP